MEHALLLLDDLLTGLDPPPPCDAAYMRKVWSKYESIPNSYNEKQIAYLIEQGHAADDIVWCASEKVHGANFSLITNGVDVLAASRTQILDASKSFYPGWQAVLEQETPRCLRAFRILKQQHGNQIKCVIIFGEFFGGLYSHHDAKFASKSKRAVQKGVLYTPSTQLGLP